MQARIDERGGIASRKETIEILTWMWISIVSISLLSFLAFGSVWTAQVLAFVGSVGTLILIRKVKSRRPKLAPVPHLSGASKCVWQMDREG